MFTNTLRFVFAGFALVAAAVTYADSPIAAGMFITGAALLSIGYFRQSKVWLAYRAQKAGRTQRSRYLLGQVANPDRLSARNRAYYHLLRGIHAIESEDYAGADTSLARITMTDLRSDNDRSMAAALRAAAAIGLGNHERASSLLAAAKEYPRRAETTAFVEKLERELGSAPEAESHLGRDESHRG